MIKEYLNSKTIQLQLEARGMEEAITKAAEPLIQMGKIRNGYVTQMINAVKELGPYMVIIPGFALAHGRPSENVIEECMSLATFKTPVVFGHETNDPVKIILVIASPSDGGHVTALQSVSKLLMNNDFIKTLEETSDCDAVIKFF